MNLQRNSYFSKAKKHLLGLQRCHEEKVDCVRGQVDFTGAKLATTQLQVKHGEVLHLKRMNMDL